MSLPSSFRGGTCSCLDTVDVCCRREVFEFGRRLNIVSVAGRGARAWLLMCEFDTWPTFICSCIIGRSGVAGSLNLLSRLDEESPRGDPEYIRRFTTSIAEV
jgi:hypothetical protein